MQSPPPEPDDRDENPGFLRRGLALLSPRPVWDWLGDSGRLVSALFLLNGRKTLFRLGKGRCPCQDPSDSGRAWETGCDAVSSWHSPGRFQRVCPLLRRNPEGVWRCSVDAADVRPFWGRACGYFGGLGVATYLFATVVALLFLRGVGYPVRYRSVAWPPDWHEVREARARYFFAKASQALQAHRPVEALMSLSQSYQLDPSNYSAGEILAQLWESSGADYSNQLYRKLMKDHPAERAATAQAWFGALLAHGDFASVEALARERLTGDPEPRNKPVWLNALVFASRRTGDTASFAPLLQNSSLPSYVRQVCAWEIQLRAASPEETRRLLSQPVPPDVPAYLLYYRIDRLLAAGLADDAWLQLLRYKAKLANDGEILLLRAYGALGWTGFLEGEVDKVLAHANAAAIESLSAYLIGQPSVALVDKVGAALQKRPLPADGQQLGAYASLFCAAGAAGDWALMRGLGDALKRSTGARLAVLDSAGAFFRGDPNETSLAHFLPALPPLRLEVDYALFDFADRRLQAHQPAKPIANPTTTAP